MKKTFVYSLLAILALTGCQAELEEVSNNDRNDGSSNERCSTDRSENRCKT